jgi:hypothetical protein
VLSLHINCVVKLLLVISLHAIISYTCGVLYVLTLAIFSVYCCYALVYRCYIPLFRPHGRVISFLLRLKCNKHVLYYLFHYLSLYV